MADEGPLWEAEERLKVTLADCKTFREWTSTETPARAHARIHHAGLPKPADNRDVHTVAELNNYRPYAIVYTHWERGLTLQADSVGEGFEFVDGGLLMLRLVQTCPDSLADHQPTSESNELWAKTVGKIIKDLCKLSGKSDLVSYLAFHRLRLEAGPYAADPAIVPDQGLWQGVELSLEWGMTG